MKFIKGIEKRYGYELASKVASDFTRLATIAQTNDYLDELNSLDSWLGLSYIPHWSANCGDNQR